MRTQLSRLGVSLHAVVQMIDPSVKEAAAKAKQEVVQRALAGAEEEHKKALARKVIIERRKEVIETEIARKEKAAAQEKAAAAAKKAEAEKKRVEEEVKRREEERIKRIQDEVQRDQAKRIAEEISSKTGLQLKPEEIEQSDVKTLLDLKVSRLQTEQKELSDRLKQISKRIDHTERAYRKEEIPLLEKDYEQQQKTDKAFYEASRKAELATSKAKFEENMKLKSRFSRIIVDYRSYKGKIEAARKEATDAKLKAANESIEKEKQERIAQWREKKAEADRLRKQEEAEIARREQEEREAAEAAEIARIEKEAKLAKEKEAYAKERERLDEIARKQREREEEVERKIAADKAAALAKSSTPPPARTAYTPPGARTTDSAAAGGGWRSREAGRAASTAASSTPERSDTGAWRNVNRSTNNERSSRDFERREGGSFGGERRTFGDRREGSGYGGDRERREGSGFGGPRREGSGFGGNRDDRRDERPRGGNRGAGAGARDSERKW
jgi:translation initiation factor 3 subunit A